MGFVVSEKTSFENVVDGRSTDGRWLPAYTWTMSFGTNELKSVSEVAMARYLLSKVDGCCCCCVVVLRLR